MARQSPQTARDRFVTEAARLFAEQGYAATSVADIQLACGLTGGSGALYKHFRSKRALLEAVIDTHITTMRESSRSFADRLPGDLAGDLWLIARTVWAGMERDRQVLRVMLRDLDDFPDVLAAIWGEVRADVYDEFTRWLTTQSERGAVCVTDPAATAAVLLASLTYYPILHTLIDRTPGDLDAERFCAAWLEHALTTLTSPTPEQATDTPRPRPAVD